MKLPESPLLVFGGGAGPSRTDCRQQAGISSYIIRGYTTPSYCEPVT